MSRHLRLWKSGACATHDKKKITPVRAADGVQLCGMPMKELTKGNKLAVNTAALGATLQLLGIESEPLETVIARRSEEHTSELQSLRHLVCRLLLEKKKKKKNQMKTIKNKQLRTQRGSAWR